MKRFRPFLLLAILALLGGCSSLSRIEVQNDGPGPVTVTFRYVDDDGRKREEEVEVPAGGAEIEGLWFGAPPERLEITAKWKSTIVSRSFRESALPPGLRHDSSSGGMEGLSVSPQRFRWVPLTLWVRLQNPALIPFVLFAIVVGIVYWIRYRRQMRQAPPPAPLR